MDVENILNRSENTTLLLSFITDWSGASHIQSIFIKQLVTEFSPQLELVEWDVNETEQGLLDYFHVNRVPTTMILQNRDLVGFWEGLTSKNKMRKAIRSCVD